VAVVTVGFEVVEETGVVEKEGVWMVEVPVVVASGAEGYREEASAAG
jgi:hypothetical protein